MRAKWQRFYSEFDFREVLFEAPITLKIGAVTLLDNVQAPLYSVAADGIEALEALKARDIARFEIPGTSYALQFAKDQGGLRVLEEAEGMSVRTDYDELRSAWERFATRVREFVSENFPDVADHPDVGSWFRPMD
jgi:hypothetical protein